MPAWGELLVELRQLNRPDALDVLRQKYVAALAAHTKRATIVYATRFTQSGLAAPPDTIQINEEDMEGLMEVFYKLACDGGLDLVLHSPGGSPEAAEALVHYLHSKFPHIRVIVPHLAMSAATMLSCAGDEIVMGKHSFLGPTDPQITLRTALGVRTVPAQAILDQFDRAQKECKDPTKVPAWYPMLGYFGPDLLEVCERFLKLSRELVETWLKSRMFKGDADAAAKASAIANWFAGEDHKSHGRHFSRDECQKHGLKITELEKDQTLQDLVLSVYHATTLTFANSMCVKIIENHNGRGFYKQITAAPGAPQPGT